MTTKAVDVGTNYNKCPSESVSAPYILSSCPTDLVIPLFNLIALFHHAFMLFFSLSTTVSCISFDILLCPIVHAAVSLSYSFLLTLSIDRPTLPLFLAQGTRLFHHFVFFGTLRSPARVHIPFDLLCVSAYNPSLAWLSHRLQPQCCISNVGYMMLIMQCLDVYANMHMF